jgi:hypothetical protein
MNKSPTRICLLVGIAVVLGLGSLVGAAAPPLPYLQPVVRRPAPPAVPPMMRFRGAMPRLPSARSRVGLIPIPTTWDAAPMPIPTEWDAKVVLLKTQP